MNLSFRRGTHRRTPEAWAAMGADLAAIQERLATTTGHLATADRHITALVTERDALTLRVAGLEERLRSDATVTQEMPVPCMAEPTPIRSGPARFQTFMQGARAARGAA